MDWARVLAYVTGTVDQELLARNEYLAAENRILTAQLMGRLKLSDAERSVLGEISHRLGRKVLAAAAFILGVPGDDMETGLALVEKAIGLNRNNAEAFRAGAVFYAFKGEIDRAVEHQQQAERLNPLDASWNGNMIYPIAYFGVGDHEKVVDWTARILRERPNVVAALRYRAASLALLGRTEARQVIARLLEHAPGYTVSEVRRHHEFDLNSPFKKPVVAESLYRGLRLAGLPE